jgi:hypothetical protein
MIRLDFVVSIKTKQKNKLLKLQDEFFNEKTQ